MKKNYLSIFALITSTLLYSQVGINTANPKTTLDITAKSATGTSSSAEGILIPRVDRERAQSMTNIETSTLIYVNSISTGTQIGLTVNVDDVGYYYYNGTSWTKLNPSTATVPDNNIYNSDGILTTNRIVTQGTHTLAFTGTAVNAFSVDGNTFSVSAADDKVGIGTASPSNKLHVVASTASAGKFNLFDAPEGTLDNVITGFRNTSSLATGNRSLIGFANNGPAAGGANWGIGSIRSGATLTNGNEEDFFVGNSTGGNYVERIRIKPDGSVGIGTSTPTNKLHITGTNPVRMEGITMGNSATDDIMVLDNTGIVKKIGSLGSLSIPTPTIFRLETLQTNFLSSAGAGVSQTIPMTLIKNAIPGLSYNQATSTITFPAGTYQITFVYEATHNAANCDISSYFIDFPLNSTSTRIHNTASHAIGGSSNHGGTITYATTIPANKTWQIYLGRGQSGNCSGPGMELRNLSTQLLIFRLGN